MAPSSPYRDRRASQQKQKSSFIAVGVCSYILAMIEDEDESNTSFKSLLTEEHSDVLVPPDSNYLF